MVIEVYDTVLNLVVCVGHQSGIAKTLKHFYLRHFIYLDIHHI